jgi:hypothetical protein
VTFAEAITAIRTATRYDTVSPSPVTDAQVTVWLNSELQRFRALINSVAPQLYRATSADLVIASGAQTLTQPAGFDILVRVEKSVGGRWVNVEPAQDADAEAGPLGFEEVGSTYLIWPSLQAPGTYRLIYNTAPTDGTLAVPAGLEDVPVERVCARVKERLAPEEVQLHLAIADRIWAEQLPVLRRAFGRNNQAGFRPSYRAGRGYGPSTR